MEEKTLIGGNRTIIMGIAALWIMLFHGTIDLPLKVVNVVIGIGYLGVDVFMFMSGYSMYNSYVNSCGRNKKLYIQRRIKKLFPTFIPFAIIWLSGYLIKYDSLSSLKMAFLDKEFIITLLTFRWFIPCIFLCYLLTPLVDFIFKRIRDKGVACVISTIPFILLAIIFIGSSTAQMFLVRIPEFIIGYYYNLAKGGKKVNLILRTGIILVGFLIYFFLLNSFDDVFLLDSGLYWYPAIFIVSSLTLVFAKLGSVLKSNTSILKFMGKYSLELYLWHVYFMYPLFEFFDKYNLKFDNYNIFINIVSIIVACIVAWAYAQTVNKIEKVIYYRYVNKIR